MSISTNYVKKTGFLSGITTIPQTSTAQDIKKIPRTRGDDEIIGTRPSFTKAPIKARFIQDFAKLRQLQIEREGILVNLGSNILSKLFTVEMRDENNPSVLIKKQVSLGQLLLSQEGRLAAIQSILNTISSRGSLNAASELENLNVLSSLVVKTLTDIVEKNERLSDDKMTELIKANDQLLIPSDPSQLGIPPFITKDFLQDGRSGYLLAYLMYSKNITDPNLSPKYPVYGLNGNPIVIRTMIRNIRRGYILDVINRGIVRQEEEKEQEEQEEERVISGISGTLPGNYQSTYYEFPEEEEEEESFYGTRGKKQWRKKGSK